MILRLIESNIATFPNNYYNVAIMIKSKRQIILIIKSRISNDSKLDLCILYGSTVIDKLSVNLERSIQLFVDIATIIIIINIQEIVNENNSLLLYINRTMREISR